MQDGMVGAMSVTVSGKVTVEKLKNISSATRPSSTAISHSDVMWYNDSGTSSLWSSPETQILG